MKPSLSLRKKSSSSRSQDNGPIYSFKNLKNGTVSLFQDQENRAKN